MVRKSVILGLFVFFSGCSYSTPPEKKIKTDSVKAKPGFQCSKATSVVEKHICASTELSQLDARMSRFYKDARSRNIPDIKSSQREWIKSRNNCQKANKADIDSCLLFLYKQRVAELAGRLSVVETQTAADTKATVSDAGIRLPANYQDLSQIELLGVLGAGDRCREKTEQHKKRYVQFYNFDNQDQLLALACEIGAYQDHYLTFYLKKNNATYKAYPMSWQLPVFNQKWLLEKNIKIGGKLQIESKNRTLTSLRLYSAFGSCGYQVNYDLSHLTNQNTLESLTPVSLTADNDCENGVLVDDWPVVSL